MLNGRPTNFKYVFSGNVFSFLFDGLLEVFSINVPEANYPEPC